MINKYFGGEITNPNVSEDVDLELIKECTDTVSSVAEKMKTLRVADSLDAIFALARRSNKYIDETMPWALAKDEAKSDRLKTVLYNLSEAIRVIGVLLSPFMPETGKNILTVTGAADATYESILSFDKERNVKVGEAKPLFARLDEAKKLEEVEADLFKPVEEAKEEEKEEFITIDDFDKIKLKTAKVLAAEKVEKADKLLKLTVEVGNEVRTVVSGIAKSYTPEDMVGKTVILITNLKPAKIRGIESNGMILATSDDGEINIITTHKEGKSGLEVG